MVKKQKRLGELLVDAGYISQEQLVGALSRQRQWGDRLGANLIATGAITEDKLRLFFARQTGIEEFDLEHNDVAHDVATMIPHKVAEQFNLIPVKREGKNTLIVACADPTDLNALDQISFITGLKVVPVISSYSSIVNAINQYMLGIYNQPGEEDSQIVRHSAKKAADLDASDTFSEDPDLIIFGGNHRMAKSQEAPAEREAEPEPEAAAEPEPGPSLDEELGFDFGRPLLKYASEPQSAPESGPSLDASQFTFEQKMRALYQVLVRKGLVSEQEINSELMRMWSLGELK